MKNVTRSMGIQQTQVFRTALSVIGNQIFRKTTELMRSCKKNENPFSLRFDVRIMF